MTDFLEQVVAERRADAERAHADPADTATTPADNAWTYGHRTTIWLGMRPRAGDHDAFTMAVRHRKREGRLAVIAEVKRVSPALGTIAADIDPARQARIYAEAGAAAISVLTEPRHWGGSLRDLAAVREAVQHVPLLCKDVIVSEHQVREARRAGADAVLLIAEALSDVELKRFSDLARSLDMGVLVEAHEPVAFGRAAASGAAVVGVNARNLRDPRVIDIGRVRQLHTFARAEQLLVAESGIASVEDGRLLPARVDAVLVGTALMRADDPRPLIAGLCSIRRTVTV